MFFLSRIFSREQLKNFNFPKPTVVHKLKSSLNFVSFLNSLPYLVTIQRNIFSSFRGGSLLQYFDKLLQVYVPVSHMFGLHVLGSAHCTHQAATQLKQSFPSVCYRREEEEEERQRRPREAKEMRKIRQEAAMASFQLFARHGPGHLGNIGSSAKRGKTRREGEEEREEEEDGEQGRRRQRL